MVSTIRGRNIHKHLVNKASRFFSDKGYTVLKEAKMTGRTRIDVLAIKGSERIGIECQLTISHKIIKAKFENYGKELTKMIFFVPVAREGKTKKVLEKISKEEKLAKDFFDIWTENVDITTTIRLSKKAKTAVDEVAKEIGKFGDTYDDILLKLTEHYKKCKRRETNGKT